MAGAGLWNGYSSFRGTRVPRFNMPCRWHFENGLVVVVAWSISWGLRPMLNNVVPLALGKASRSCGAGLHRWVNRYGEFGFVGGSRRRIERPFRFQAV